MFKFSANVFFSKKICRKRAGVQNVNQGAHHNIKL